MGVTFPFPALLRRVMYEWRYLRGRPPWDTGITPPELVDLVEREKFSPGRALDIGCGTGTNVLYLANHGFTVTGIDFVPRAIERARRRIDAAGAHADLLVGNVLEPRPLGPFDLVLDIGCFHNFAGEDRARYARNLAAWTHPGSLLLLYAFYPLQAGMRQFGVSPVQVGATFEPEFRLVSSSADPGRDDQDSAWYRMEKQ